VESGGQHTSGKGGNLGGSIATHRHVKKKGGPLPEGEAEEIGQSDLFPRFETSMILFWGVRTGGWGLDFIFKARGGSAGTQPRGGWEDPKRRGQKKLKTFKGGGVRTTQM